MHKTALFPIAPLPKIPPHKRGKRRHQIQAHHGGVKLPILPMHAARAAFQYIRDGGDDDKAQRKLGEVMQNGFAFKRDDAQAALGEKREIGDKQREQQQGVHGGGHGGLSINDFQAA